MRLICAGVVIAVLTLFSGCQSTEGAAADDGAMQQTAANRVCPMQDDHEIDPEVTTRFEGTTVGFCCERCLSAWERMTDEQRRDKLEAATAASRATSRPDR